MKRTLNAKEMYEVGCLLKIVYYYCDYIDSNELTSYVADKLNLDEYTHFYILREFICTYCDGTELIETTQTDETTGIKQKIKLIRNNNELLNLLKEIMLNLHNGTGEISHRENIYYDEFMSEVE